MDDDKTTWWDRNGIWIVFLIYGALFLAAYFHLLPPEFFKPWY